MIDCACALLKALVFVSGLELVGHSPIACFWREDGVLPIPEPHTMAWILPGQSHQRG